VITHTAHSATRAAQRGLSDDEIEYVYQYGSRYHCGGALIFYMRRQDLPIADRRYDWAAQLVGTAVVMSSYDGAIITVWRNRRTGLKRIRTWPHRAGNPLAE
jgi:hypothetical protein